MQSAMLACVDRRRQWRAGGDFAAPLVNPTHQVEQPELFGIEPLDPHAKTSIGEHAAGNNRSRYTSASTKPRGAPNMQGTPKWIDLAKAKKDGVVFHSTEEICRDLDRLAQENPSQRARFDRLKDVITHVEGEVLMEGRIPAAAVKSAASMHITQGLRFVQVVGVAMTVVDVSRATVRSVQRGSAAPIAAEAFRQVGGWGGSAIGGLAGAWAAAKIGGVVGGTLFVETGPGAILAGVAGGLIFGTAGYFGADWVADIIDEN
ncbi:MAG: glycine zipper family protein [Polyangiales bacterium]